MADATLTTGFPDNTMAHKELYERGSTWGELFRPGARALCACFRHWAQVFVLELPTSGGLAFGGLAPGGRAWSR